MKKILSKPDTFQTAFKPESKAISVFVILAVKI